MKSSIVLFLLLFLPLPGWGQAPGFRKLYHGASTGAAFADLLWDGEKLIVTGQFLTDTAPDNALNGLLYLELDTNGNVQQTDLYFYPNDALTPDIQNSIFQSATGQVYAMSQIFYDTAVLLSVYENSELLATVRMPVEGLNAWLYHAVDLPDALLLAARRVNHQYDSEGLLIKTDKTGNPLWQRYYGQAGLNCGIAEPFILDNNTMLLPGYRHYWPGSGPAGNRWTRSWLVATDSLGNTKWQWESPKNTESGIATRLQRLPDNSWLYLTAEFTPPQPGQTDDFGLHPKIVCRDSSFQLLWEKYLPATPTSACYMIDLKPTSDGNFVAAGFWNKNPWWGASVIHKFTPSGDSLWTFRDECTPFLGCRQQLGGVVELPGGSIVAAGYLEDYATNWASGLLIKLDKNGCLDSLCGIEINNFEPDRISKVKLYPNPVVDVLTIENPIGATLTLFDSVGRQVLQTNVQGNLQMVNLSALPSGIYWLRMQERAINASYLVVKR